MRYRRGISRFSRFGQEAITGSATVTLAMLCFLRGRDAKDLYLMASAVLFGLSLYSYWVVKVFTPLMIGLLMVLYRRELGQVWRKALVALGVMAVIAAPASGSYDAASGGDAGALQPDVAVQLYGEVSGMRA